MKLKERLLAASLGFVAALGLILILQPAKDFLRPEAVHQSSSLKSPRQRNLQKTDSASGHQSEQQIEEHHQQIKEWNSVAKKPSSVRNVLLTNHSVQNYIFFKGNKRPQ